MAEAVDDATDHPPMPGLDPVLTLAQTMHSTPTAYAVLLGAGVSIAAGVPSAWGVVEQLVQRLADQEEADVEGDAIAWYRARFDREPAYEQLLEALAPTRLERQRLLAGFFSPVDGPTGVPGLREPSPAHRALARLVASGHVRVVLTLNFDRLAETALREAGIEPTVVASTADLAGLAPLQTLSALVVHLHGDYLSASTMLNTTAELEVYPDEVNQFLDKVLTDYGVVIVGWSATYDPALRDAVARQSARHFTSYWVDPAPLQSAADDLRVARAAVKVTSTADIALGRLADAVTALNAKASRHFLTVPVAVATAKRELAGQPVAIGLHDQIHAEFDRLRRNPDQARTNFHAFPDQGTFDDLYARVDESLVVPCALVATTAYWGTALTDRWWLPEITRYGTRPSQSGLGMLLNTLTVPAAHLLYVAGVAAAASQRWDLLKMLVSDLEVDINGRRELLAYWVATPGSVYRETGEQAPSLRLYTLHLPTFIEHLGLGQNAYDDAWEHFEFLRLVQISHAQQAASQAIGDILAARATLAACQESFDEAERTGTANQLADARGHRARARREVGQALGRYAGLVAVDRPHLRVVADYDQNSLTHHMHPSVVGRQLLAEVRRSGSAHPLLLAGFCGGDPKQFETTVEAVDMAIGTQGHDAAYRDLGGRVGVVPDYFWLDTRLRPNR